MFDSTFWVTLAINAVLTLLLGLIAIIIAPVASAKLTDFLYTRRVSRTLKQKQKELSAYNLVKAFHQGTKDKQFYYVFLSTFAIGFFIAAAISFILVTILAGENYFSEKYIVGFFVGCICLLLGILMLVGMRTTATNLENFNEYEKRVKDRWPDA
jgi:hypothetical protein